MFEYDICVCGNAEDGCPNKETCERYLIRKRMTKGVFTASLFYDLGEVRCKYYIPVKPVEKEEK